eukprot:2712892-Amphidinium_carterae.1
MHDWESTARYATFALEPEGDEYQIKQEDHVMELRLRRATALLGGLSMHKRDEEATEVPALHNLKQAEEDLWEVVRHRPKEPAAMHGLKVVAFLRKQTMALQLPEPRVRGIERIRTEVRP